MSSSISAFFERPNLGLLVLRVVVGALMIYYGVAKFMGAIDGDAMKVFSDIGRNIAVIGIPAPDRSITAVLFGIAAASAELLGGVCLILGFCFRPALFFVGFTMTVATVMHWNLNEGADDILKAIAFPGLLLVIAVALLFTGPGELALSAGPTTGSKKAKGGAGKKPAAKKKPAKKGGDED